MANRTIISTRALKDITWIDAGNTLVIEFEDAQGGTVNLLVPSREIASLDEKLTAAMAEAGDVKAEQNR
jgi:hypothetical protein